MEQLVNSPVDLLGLWGHWLVVFWEEGKSRINLSLGNTVSSMVQVV